MKVSQFPERKLRKHFITGVTYTIVASLTTILVSLAGFCVCGLIQAIRSTL